MPIEVLGQTPAAPTVSPKRNAERSAYLAMLDRYEGGDFLGAAETALGLDRASTGELVDLLAHQADRAIADAPLGRGGSRPPDVLFKRRRERVRLLTLVLLVHTEAAVRTVEPADLESQLALAGLAIDRLKKLKKDIHEHGPVYPQSGPGAAARDSRESIDEIVHDWYLAVASHLQAAAPLDDLDAHLASGLATFPEDPDLLLARGTAAERWASVAVIDRSVATAVYVPGLVARWRQYLHDADRDYRRALGDRDQLHEARLRHGRVNALLGERRAAHLALVTLTESDAPSRSRYLAWLFLGELAESASDIQRANHTYEQALRLEPRSQPALLALSRLCDAQADDACARAWLDRSLAEASEARRDPWWDYQLGQAWLGETRLSTLRARGLGK